MVDMKGMIILTKMNEQMQQKMKQMLENIPRFDYKVIKFFDDKSEMQKAIDTLYNNGIMNLNSRTLTDNYINEIYELYIFMPKEGLNLILSAIVGGIIGGIIGWLHGNTMISLPLLNPASAGGRVVTTVLGAGIGSVLLATYISIMTLFRPIKSIKPGQHMLTIYADAERKRDINDILSKFKFLE